MAKDNSQAVIESNFRKQVRNDKNVRSAFLLVHSEKLGIHLSLAEGGTEGRPATPEQPHYMASVGKLFTSTLIGIMHDQGKLSFDDPISKYLDAELMNGLNVYKGTDYSGDIRICHLLNQTSGLNDVFLSLVGKTKKKTGSDHSTRSSVMGQE
jgi:D-alanyl-D-alanine carboxypeptidase